MGARDQRATPGAHRARTTAVAVGLAAALALTGCSALPFGASAGEPEVEASAVQAPATVADLPVLDGVVAGVPEGWTPTAVGALQLAVPAGWTDLGMTSPEGWDYRTYVHPVTPAAAAAEALAVSADGATVVTRTLEVSALQGASTWKGGWADMTGQQGFRLDVPGATLAGVDLLTEPAFEGATVEILRAQVHLQTAAGAYVLVEVTAPAGDAGLAELRTLVGTFAMV
ncbi:hypothetical protein [Actinotalea solisilvae]|uniref:hypothetical protein n=1 Tax=Actinotalea solisilvae TaxID=2072922 RepID=UPI0018F24FC6|nr:hypothetical protein [Actinotalea solisilvae]